MWARALDAKQQGERGRWKQTESPPGDGADAMLPITWEAIGEPSTRLRTSVSVPAVVGVVAFLAAVACTAVFFVQGLNEGGGAVANVSSPIVTDATGSDRDEPGGPIAGQPTSDATADTEVVFVHVVGEVLRPGVVKLELGARIGDAVDAAGGAAPAALLQEMNLARKVVDGERIVVPNVDTLHSISELQQSDSVGVAGRGPAGLINVNAASAAACETLPGIGPVIAARIVAWREANGPFASIDQLTEVSGISVRMLEGFRDLVTV